MSSVTKSISIIAEIGSIHDGSFFSEIVKYGWFLPSGILLLALSLTGIYMFFIPILRKRKKNK